jgi:signal transduction histidine kinase
VLGYTGLLLKSDDVPEEKKEHLRTIERETLRAREILKNLLDVSRRKPPNLVRADIAGIIEDTISLVKGQAKVSHVEIKIECPTGLPLVAVDTDGMKQVFVNLINNAFFAMPSGGTMTVRCGAETDERGRKLVVVGLSISFMVVQNYGGRIEVESIVGQGSTFRVILPAQEEGLVRS